jgi:hypothetical protein
MTIIAAEKAMVSDDGERSLMTEAELRDACLHCAATVVIAMELGCEFEDCRLTDDGYKWPTFTSSVDIKYPASWSESGAEAFPAIATIHEAGCQAVAKQHGRGPCRINNYTATRTSDLLDEPRIWNAIEKLADYIHDNDDGEGCYGAAGTDIYENEEDSEAITLVKSLLQRAATAIGTTAWRGDLPEQRRQEGEERRAPWPKLVES